jgi:hypothetical protein
MTQYLYLQNYPAVHGVDYRGGLEEGQECGRVHEFATRKCQPIIYTQEQKDRLSYPTDQDRWVEVTPFRDDNEDSSNNSS